MYSIVLNKYIRDGTTTDYFVSNLVSSCVVLTFGVPSSWCRSGFGELVAWYGRWSRESIHRLREAVTLFGMRRFIYFKSGKHTSSFVASSFLTGTTILGKISHLTMVRYLAVSVSRRRFRGLTGSRNGATQYLYVFRIELGEVVSRRSCDFFEW